MSRGRAPAGPAFRHDPRARVAGATLTLLAAALGGGSSLPAASAPAASVPPVPSRRARVAGSAPFRRAVSVSSWGYQLQGYGLRRLERLPAELLVVDYSRTGGPEGELSAEQVARLQDGPCGRRLVLAYLSIGEAEDYRYYFDASWVDESGAATAAAPGFLGPTNPAWAGNYKVRYWRRDWQRILFGVREGAGKSYLDRILDAGFDGVYLDIVDAYEFWGPAEIGGNDERRRAPVDMVRLVRRLARYARRTRGRPEFLLVPQNGSGLIDADSYPDAVDPEAEAARQRRRYLRMIDAIGAEDTFFFGDRDMNNPLRPQRYVLDLLEVFRAAGRPVLAIEYLSHEDKIARFLELAAEHGFAPAVGPRALDSPAATPGAGCGRATVGSGR